MSIRCKEISPKKFEISTANYEKIIEVDLVTPTKINEFRDTFGIFDKEGNGLIKVEQLGMVMRSLGQSTSEAELKELIRDFCEDNDDITFDTFVQIMDRKLETPPSEEEVLKAFKVFDMKGNERINVADLRHILCALGDTFTADETTEIIQSVVKDENGDIDYGDLIQKAIEENDLAYKK